MKTLALLLASIVAPFSSKAAPCCCGPECDCAVCACSDSGGACCQGAGCACEGCGCNAAGCCEKK